MAEVVFQNLEGMLPELEELEQQGVFSREELRIIIKRRTDYEYKLQKRIVNKQDILNYLEYELKLNLLQKKRSKVTKRASKFKRMKLKLYSTAALSVTRRIHTLFRKALLKFGNDMKLWMQYINFCKKTESSRALGLAFGKLIQQHASNPEVWLMAAKHEFEEVNNAENARSLMQRALRNHKGNRKLWLEHFRLELLHVEKIKKRRKVLGIDGIEVKESDDSEPKEIEEFLANKTALIVFQNAIKQINDVCFCLDFIKICEKFEDTDGLEDTIYSCIIENFPADETVYEALGKKPISRLRKHSDQIITDERWKTVENQMEENFQEALEIINTSLMWEKYINTYAELLRDSSSPEIAQRRMNRILSLLKSAESNKHATESMYIFWSDLLISIGENTGAEECLQNAVNAFKHNESLWLKYLVLKSETVDSWSDYQALFKKCLISVKQPSLQIWEMYIDVASSLPNEETKLVFEDAMLAGKEVREKLLPHYVDWLLTTSGIKATRKFYSRILKETYPYDFLVKCLEIETTQDSVNVKRIRIIYERLIDSYGKTDEDIWLDYIQFEKEYCGDDIERPGLLYTKAKRTLEGKHTDEFLTKYSLLVTET